MNQIIFDFPAVDEFYEEDFIVSTSNLKAYNMLVNFSLWPDRRLLLKGDEGSGKSHLAKIFAIKTKAIFLESEFNLNNLPMRNMILENIETLYDETKFFHLINFAKNNNLFLLLTFNSKNHRFELPDLVSRLNSTSKVSIKSPDEVLFRTILHKNFYDRQITLEPEVIDFIAKRLQRSFKSIKEFVEKVNNLSLLHQRPITIPLIKIALTEDD